MRKERLELEKMELDEEEAFSVEVRINECDMELLAVRETLDSLEQKFNYV